MPPKLTPRVSGFGFSSSFRKLYALVSSLSFKIRIWGKTNMETITFSTKFLHFTQGSNVANNVHNGTQSMSQGTSVKILPIAENVYFTYYSRTEEIITG